MTERRPDISIVIPTYNERDNIAAVVRDIFSVALEHRCAIEVIIVDDNSPDGTGQEAEYLARQFPVTVIHREGKLGLGTAAMAGFARASGRIWGLMDGDRSHPAETLPELIEPIREGRCDLAIASRYVEGGAVEQWPWHRWVLSHAATLLGRLFSGGVRDPLSGFLFFDRSVVEGVPLTVGGYKIGLEILIKGRYNKVLEVPYTFRNREVGQSKLGWSEYINYLQSLVRHTFFVFRRARRRSSPTVREGRLSPAAPGRLWGPCPLCGADNGAFLFVKNTYRHVRCRRCGLIYVNPAPSPGELRSIYEDPRYFANRNEWAYGYNDYFAEREFYDALFERRVRECEQALGRSTAKSKIQNPKSKIDGRLRLLDVGCAAGFLLEAARRRGHAVAGVEISPHAAEFANQRLDGVVHHGTLEDARFEDRSFDCVVMLDILEHTPDPVAMLREAARILKPGGVLLLSAPNVRSLSARLFGRRWFHFKRDHVVLFDDRTLLGALDAAGLDGFELRRNGKMVSLNYLFARLKVYVPWLGKLLLATAGRLGICDRLFYYSWTGELLAFCRKPDATGETLPPPAEIHGRCRALWWPPTALWRTAEYYRLRGIAAKSPVLDLGCGDGRFGRMVLAPDLWDQVIGIDRNLRGQAASPLITHHSSLCAVADAGALPLRSGGFGFVLANCVLEHVDRLDDALGEIARVLRPGGRLVFTVPSEQFGEMLFVSHVLGWIGLRPLGRAYAALVNRILGHRNVLSESAWRDRLERVGLAVEKVEYFMPAPLARAWDRRLWWGTPGYLLGRLIGRRRRRPRPSRLSAHFADLLAQPSPEGAGAAFSCRK